MEITKEWLKEKEACSEGLEWFIHQSETDLFKLIDKLIKKRKDWANWLIIKAMNRQQQLQYAIACAKLVLPIFETKYPLDRRPRAAIEAAKAVLEEDSQENRDVAACAAHAAYRTTYRTTDVARAAYAAAAAERVAYAACTVNTVSSAADATAAVWSAARAADWKQVLEIGIDILKGKN